MIILVLNASQHEVGFYLIIITYFIFKCIYVYINYYCIYNMYLKLKAIILNMFDLYWQLISDSNTSKFKYMG